MTSNVILYPDLYLVYTSYKQNYDKNSLMVWLMTNVIHQTIETLTMVANRVHGITKSIAEIFMQFQDLMQRKISFTITNESKARQGIVLIFFFSKFFKKRWVEALWRTSHFDYYQDISSKLFIILIPDGSTSVAHVYVPRNPIKHLFLTKANP